MNIYIGNLSPEMTKDELCKEFTVFGEVISVTIMNDRYIGSGQQRNYGYIEMASHSEAIDAITNLEGKRLRNLIVSVIRARPLSDKPGTVPNNVRGTRRFSKIRERTDI